MYLNRVAGFIAAAFITAAQWSVFFDLHLPTDPARILAAAVVAEAAATPSSIVFGTA